MYMWGIFYFTGTEIPKPSHWIDVYFVVLFLFPILAQSLGGISRARTENKSYKVIFDDDAIKLEQLGSWDELVNQQSLILSVSQIPWKILSA